MICQLKPGLVIAETRNTAKEILTVMMPLLNERQQRFLMGSCAKGMGHGGISVVNEITGAAGTIIKAGIDENMPPNSFTSDNLPF